MKFRVLQSIVFFITAFLLVGCGVFENEQIEDDPEEEIERIYNKTIERNYSNEFERALIDSAEAAYPPRDNVIAVLDSAFPNRNYDELLPVTEYWHYDSFDGILLPYSITIDAIDYYGSLIDSMKASVTHQFITKANFKYKTSISFEEEYSFERPEEWPDVVWQAFLSFGQEFGQNQLPSQLFENIYAVKMYLEWDHYCSEVCGLNFTQVRIILFNEKGDLVGIYLDGIWYPPTAI